MKLGLKLWSTNSSYIEPALELYEKKVYDYIELYVVPDSISYIDMWEELGIPFVLHAPHSLSGLNPSQKNCREQNFKLIDQIENYRKALNPSFIIFHPGLDGTLAETITQFKDIKVRFPEIHEIMLVENKPKVGINGEICIGSSVKEIASIINETGIRFCCDIGHGVCAANSEGMEWRELIKDFMLLNPQIFHLSDADIESEKDVHMNFGDGDFPIHEILDSIPQDKKITIETDKASKTDLEDFEKDALFITGIGNS